MKEIYDSRGLTTKTNMANQKRMLSKSISVSEQVADLSKDAQLFYTWSIPHADDFGLIWSSPKKLKALVVPFWDVPERTVTDYINEIVKSGLWKCVEFAGEKWFCFPKWFDYQKLRRDIKPEIFANKKAEWGDYESIKEVSCDISVRIRTDPCESVAQDKIREDKIREEKDVRRPVPDKPERHLSYLIKIPDEDIEEITKKYNVYADGIKGKAEDLYNYCTAKGKKYSNYKAFLMNALKKDFGVRKPEDVEKLERVREHQKASTVSSIYAQGLVKIMKM